MTHAMGAVVLSKKQFDKLSPRQAAAVREVADDIFARLLVATRSENTESITVIAEYNLARVPVAAQDARAFESTARQVWNELVGVLYERPLLDRLTTVLAEARR